MLKEQIKWAVEEGADFILGETFETYSEAALALKACNEFGNGKRTHINSRIITFQCTGVYWHHNDIL